MYQVCSIDGCGNPRRTRGLCSGHYGRIWRAGELLPTISLSDRFWSKVDKSAGPEGCWPWTGYRMKSGYGQLARGTRSEGRVLAHRVAFELAYGHPPTNHVLHACDNGWCVNPLHLRDGTDADNAADKVARHRQIIGIDTASAVLNDEAVRVIRVAIAGGCTISQIARAFRVHRTTIRDVRERRTWAHVT